MGRKQHRPPGEVIGTPGGGLQGATWAANKQVARIGQRGEQRTAEYLNALAAAPGGPTVLHDLAIPMEGISANIDHAVISGRDVWLLDTKMWKPGFYWTLAGLTRRGWHSFPYADKKTMLMAHQAILRYRIETGVWAQIRHPIVLVWPSSLSPRQLRLWAAKTPGATLQLADGFFASRGPRRWRSADPEVVQFMAALVHQHPTPAPSGVPRFGA